MRRIKQPSRFALQIIIGAVVMAGAFTAACVTLSENSMSRSPAEASFIAEAAKPVSHLKALSTPVSVGDLSVDAVPAGLSLNTGICNYQSQNVACWGGVIADPSEKAAAVAEYGSAQESLLIQVSSGASPGYAGTPGAVEKTLDGTETYTLLQGGFEFISFALVSRNESVQVRFANISSSDASTFVRDLVTSVS